MTTIEMDQPTKRFYQGVVTANKVLDAHADTDFPDQGTRVALFYFYAGALAADEYKCETQEDFTNFLRGLATRAPHVAEVSGGGNRLHLTNPQKAALITALTRYVEEDHRNMEPTDHDAVEVLDMLEGQA